MTEDQQNKFVSQQNRGSATELELKHTGAAFEELRKAYSKAWENSDPRDTDGREKIWVAMTILSKIEGQLRTYVNNGKIAQKELDAIRTTGEPEPSAPIALNQFRRA